MPRRLAADTETLTERYGRFSAQPFERGFGTTVGNSLRRALLSSIEGAAVTAVKIEGVEHEFSSIRGVVEDAADVILNLKQVPFNLHGNEPKTLRISKSGPGEVTAGENPFYNEEWTGSAWLILRDYAAPRVLGRHLESAAEVAPLTAHIRSVHTRSHCTHGAPRIHAELRATGTRLVQKRGARLMRIAGLAGGCPKPFRRTTIPAVAPAAQPLDLVRGDFELAALPLEVFLRGLDAEPALQRSA